MSKAAETKNMTNTSSSKNYNSTRTLCTTICHEYFSTLSTYDADDCGEHDISLRRHQYELSGRTEPSSSLQSKDEITDLLEEQMADIGSASGRKLHRCISRRGSHCTLNTINDDDEKVAVRIKGDSARAVVVISTVVHILNLGDSTLVSTSHQNKKTKLKGSYTLMTKMMKYNTTFKNTPTWGCKADGGRYIACYDGKFVLFANVEASILSSGGGKLGSVVDAFISKAAEVSKDFATAPEADDAKSRRRRFLIKAYNKTMLRCTTKTS